MRSIAWLREQGLSNNAAKRALASGKVWLDGVPTGDPSREGQDFELRQNAPRIRPGLDPVVLFADDEFLVVCKPAGMLSVPAPGRKDDPELLSTLRRRFGLTLAVHRLDEPTSGLILVARNESAQTHLKDLLAERKISRRYWAVAKGRLSGATTIEESLVRDRGDGKRGVGGGPDSKHALTHVRPLESWPQGLQLVECELETGRTHQIRIHLAHIGLPLVGDTLYAPKGVAQTGPRLALHACELRVPPDHEFRCPWPDDLEAFKRAVLRRSGA